MERRVTSHTEEEEMNQRRRLLTLARKGDQKAIEQLFELYQVRVFSGDSLKRKKLPTFPLQKPTNIVPKGSYAPEKKEEKGTAKTLVGGKNHKKTAVPKSQEQKKTAAGGKTASLRKEKGKIAAVSRTKSDAKLRSSRSAGKPKKSKDKNPRSHKPVASKKIKGPKKPVKKK
ncbi:MAG: hypothetical protein AB7P17_08265 [Nitrospirales bacterium]|nr:hypothetical protein [Nitrospirales bacterium]